ncbi:Hsp70 family protein [Leifsonia sp. NCR5]|uniref:Hsp70 family protein n=1 Tax=Leifsonia sp. NCR5 TaxID=1978342 RepID=UPI000A19A1F3|nr:Hsp70 family protein [Leifsonia sp. NCR5]
MTNQVFGIDLGTTYSAIAYINDFGNAEVLRNREGDETTPSVVFFESETNFVVGKEAKNAILVNQDATVSLIKRHMGTAFTQQFFGTAFGPEGISAIILKDLVDYAKEASGVDTDKVVITVPAYFGLAEKEATRQAGVAAGLDVVGIVTEPVAAALSVGITGEETRTLFVYDLGGGTFDCTVMRVSPGVIEVIGIDGNRLLGGADWDARLFALLNEKFIAQAGLDDDPTTDEDFAQDLMTKVEETKKTLSSRERTSVTLRFGDTLEKVEVTRAEFEEATRTLVDQTLEIARRALDTAREKQPGLEIDDVLLVGGSSRMPVIEKSLQNELGWTLRKTELDLAVAKGAAIYGNAGLAFAETIASGDSSADDLGTDEKKFLLGTSTVEIRNVLSRSLGVQFVRRDPAAPNGWTPYVDFSAHGNDSLPLDAVFQGSTVSDGTTELEIHIFEQNSPVENEAPSENREVTPPEGAVLRNLPHLSADSTIEFELHIDAEGHATLTAYEPTSAQRIEMHVSLAVLQDEDVQQLKQTIAGMTRSA